MIKRDFFLEVYDVVKCIPKGRVSTYGAIATFLDSNSSRAVGWALKATIKEQLIPAHRVVNRKGELSGRLAFPTPTYMEEMLASEGVEVKAGKVVEFDTLFWDPKDHF